jgi:hypothetical protein
MAIAFFQVASIVVAMTMVSIIIVVRLWGIYERNIWVLIIAAVGFVGIWAWPWYISIKALKSGLRPVDWMELQAIGTFVGAMESQVPRSPRADHVVRMLDRCWIPRPYPSLKWLNVANILYESEHRSETSLRGPYHNPRHLIRVLVL